AAPLEDAAQLSPKELAERLRTAWLGAMRFTCTQLATGILVGRATEPRATWSLDELTHEVGVRAHGLAQSGRLVDPRLLRPQSLRERVAGYVRYLAQRKLMRSVAGNRWQLVMPLRPIEVAPGDVGYRYEPLTYAWNELQDMLSLPSAVALEQVHAAACEPGEESL
ncbi:MAG TPA: hypothetical protein VGP82_06280, partial [Ktedonobacterales bacterium]|nr:hypothetical protein [Ktedonobacterales bacterium]